MRESHGGGRVGWIQTAVGGSREGEVRELEQTESLTRSSTDGKDGTEEVHDDDQAGELFTLPEGFLPEGAT